MQGNADDKKIIVGEYGRMATGGWVSLVLGGLGLTVLLSVGLATNVVLPTGLAALVIGALMSGTVLLVGRLVLRKLDKVRVELDDHKADHTVAQIDAEHLAEIRNDMAKVLAFMARRDLEDQRVDRLAAQVEEFLKWRAEAEERQAETARKVAELADGDVIDIETLRAAREVNRHLPKRD